MPRQLPWINKGRGSKAQVKPPPKPAPTSRAQSDIDDDFFEGTVLESSRKSKRRVDSLESDDEFPTLLKSPERPSRKDREPVERSRLPSSSPPPISMEPPPKIEYMRKGVDKFDLRDDEWMMVEDEFLQTAKLFTKHLHLAEYERLKAKMEAQRNEDVSRPVIPNAKPSVEGQFKKKAREQTKAQKQAIADVFSTNNKYVSGAKVESKLVTNKDYPAISNRTGFATTTGSRKDQLLRMRFNPSTSDSDDLDASPYPTAPTATATKTTSSTPQPRSESSSTAFPKPALPTNLRARASRINRPKPFDLWDEFIPNQPALPPKSAKPSVTQQRSSSPTKMQASTIKPSEPTSTSTALSSSRVKKPGRVWDLLDDSDRSKPDPLPNERIDHLAKRKTEKEPQSKAKKSDDIMIPTFMF